MFVDIENFKSVIGVENLLMPYTKGRVLNGLRQQKEHITPDVCMQILKSTNAPLNIQHMLECIKELPPSEQAQFKDVVLATFDQREQPNDITVLGKKLAVANGFEAELSEAQKLKKGDFLLSSSKGDKGLVSLESAFRNVDFSAYEKLICLSDAKIQFLEGVKFPKHLEIPNSSDVSFVFGVYRDDYISYVGSDLSGLQSMRFKEGAKVNLSKSKNLPSQLDVSMCSEVDLSECDLTGVQSMRFKEGAKVDLIEAKNLPAQLDFAMYSVVYLNKCDFSGVQSILFNEGVHVNLSEVKNLLPQLDVSNCSYVNLCVCDLREVVNLRFKDGARVDLSKAQNLPPQLDVSTCSDVSLIGCDLSQQNLRFRDDAKVDLRNVINISPEVDLSQCAEVKLSGESWNENAYFRFKDGARVMLQYFKNLPDNIDFSKCSKVHLEFCNLSNLPHLRFKDGAEVDLKSVQKLPESVDFSQCSKVRLENSDLSHLLYLRFKEGAVVDLRESRDFPPQLDVSMCSQVKFWGCNLEDVEQLVFKNREQMEESGVKLSDDWNVKVVFVEPDKGRNLLKDGAIKKSSAHNRWGKLVGKIFGKGSR